MPAMPERFIAKPIKRGQTGINHFMPGFLRNVKPAKRFSELR